MLPLHDGARAEREAWSQGRPMACACGASLGRWQKRCPACRARNPLPGLRRRRKPLGRYLDRLVAEQALPALRRVDPVPDTLLAFSRILTEVARRPVAERQPKEPLPAYLRRLTSFFPSMFKTTSPELLVRDLEDKLARAALAITRQALAQHDQILARILEQPADRLGEESAQAQAIRVQQDLADSFRPLGDVLRRLQRYHDGMVQAWAPVRPLLLREPKAGTFKAAWDRLREWVSPAGRLFRFGQAIWRSADERAALVRLETELKSFLGQAELFRARTGTYGAIREQRFKDYRRSLQGHLAAALVDRLAASPAAERLRAIERLLAQPGVASFWHRIWHRQRATA